jgi:DNA-binding transcriptional LysR family regulator
MDVRDLRYIRELAIHANFGRAAEALNLTQPALTRRVQAVEAELGVRLFDRHSKGVVLTKFGRLVVERADGLLQGVEGIKVEVDSLRGLHAGNVNLGAGPVVAQIVGEAVGRLLRSHPKLRITVTVDNVNELTTSLRNGKTDMFIGNVSMIAGEKDLEVVSSFEHSGYFFCRPGHPILRHPSPWLPEVFEYPFVSAHLTREMTQIFVDSLGDRRFVISVECDNYPVLKKIVASSDAISLASRYAFTDELRSGELVEVPTANPVVVSFFGVVRLANRTPSPAAEALARELEVSARQVSTDLAGQVDTKSRRKARSRR